MHILNTLLKDALGTNAPYEGMTFEWADKQWLVQRPIFENKLWRCIDARFVTAPMNADPTLTFNSWSTPESNTGFPGLREIARKQKRYAFPDSWAGFAFNAYLADNGNTSVGAYVITHRGSEGKWVGIGTLDPITKQFWERDLVRYAVMQRIDADRTNSGINVNQKYVEPLLEYVGGNPPDSASKPLETAVSATSDEFLDGMWVDNSVVRALGDTSAQNVFDIPILDWARQAPTAMEMSRVDVPTTLDELNALREQAKPIAEALSEAQAVWKVYERALKDGAQALFDEWRKDHPGERTMTPGVQVRINKKPAGWDDGSVEQFLIEAGLLSIYTKIDKAKVVRGIEDNVLNVPGVELVEQPTVAIVMKDLTSG